MGKDISVTGFQSKTRFLADGIFILVRSRKVYSSGMIAIDIVSHSRVLSCKSLNA